MHLDDGEIRSYFDQEAPGNTPEISDHLASCEHCRIRSLEIKRIKNHVESSMAKMEFNPPSAQAAARDLELRLGDTKKERQIMFSKIFHRVPRFAWVSLMVFTILAVALSFPSVRAIATSFLGLFRVEQVQVIPIDPESISEGFGSADSFEKFMADEVQVEEFGEPLEAVSVEEASKTAGIPVRLPKSFETLPRLDVEPGGRMTFKVDYELARAILDEMGRQDIELPKELDAAPIVVEVQPAVMASYGDCPTEKDAQNPEKMDPDDGYPGTPPLCTTLVQTASPTISAPPGLNLGAIGEAYLQILGMSPEEAASFAANVDWTTTFVVPIPKYAEYQEVSVDGVSGTLVEHYQAGSEWFALLWVKAGIVYVLSGPGELEKALEIANSLN